MALCSFLPVISTSRSVRNPSLFLATGPSSVRQHSLLEAKGASDGMCHVFMTCRHGRVTSPLHASVSLTWAKANYLSLLGVWRLNERECDKCWAKVLSKVLLTETSRPAEEPQARPAAAVAPLMKGVG